MLSTVTTQGEPHNYKCFERDDIKITDHKPYKIVKNPESGIICAYI